MAHLPATQQHLSGAGRIRTSITLVVAIVLMAACEIIDIPIDVGRPTHADVPTDGRLADLRIAPEDGRGYDRALFGDYDRDAVLAASAVAWPGCAGHYSPADDRCHADADAVHVDHIVSLSEAWDSGASDWTTVQLDQFGGDPENLWLMTSELNLAKTDGDAAEWLPPYPPAVCRYVDRYIAVKVAWDLTVDAVEHRALADATAACRDMRAPDAQPRPTRSGINRV